MTCSERGITNPSRSVDVKLWKFGAHFEELTKLREVLGDDGLEYFVFKQLECLDLFLQLEIGYESWNENTKMEISLPREKVESRENGGDRRN